MGKDSTSINMRYLHMNFDIKYVLQKMSVHFGLVIYIYISYCCMPSIACTLCVRDCSATAGTMALSGLPLPGDLGCKRQHGR